MFLQQLKRKVKMFVNTYIPANIYVLEQLQRTNLISDVVLVPLLLPLNKFHNTRSFLLLT